MPWSGGSYTKGNAGTGGWTGDASLGIGIEAGRHDTQDNDFATGINNCLTKDGTNSATANINFGGFIPSNVGAGTAAAPAYCAGADVNTGMFSAGADIIGWATNGAERLTLDANGHLTLKRADATSGTLFSVQQWSNTTNVPALQLVKSRGSAVGTNAIVQNGDVLGSIRFLGDNGSGFNQSAVIQAAVDGTPGATNDMPGRLEFYTTADGAGTPTERMRITNSGNVGIGLSDPNYPLDVRAESTSSAAFQIRGRLSDGVAVSRFTDGSLGEIARFTSNTSGLEISASGAKILTFGTNSAERMRITNAGNVGIGTSSPTYQLQLSTDSAAKPTTNTWTIASDERLKTNVTPYEKGLAEIKQIDPIRYDYNGKGGFPEGPGGISIIAQAIQPIFPECVGTFLAKLNEEDETETELYNYNGHAITFALINAVKELAAKVEALEALQAA